MERTRASRPAGRPDPCEPAADPEEQLDESLEETFPASDPPAHGGILCPDDEDTE